MIKFCFSILAFILVQSSLFASSGEKRLSKKNIAAIHSKENATLVLNDINGNVFHYNGNQVQLQDFPNQVDSPTFILSIQDQSLLYVHTNSVFLKHKEKDPEKLFSFSMDEKITKAIQDPNFYYISGSSALYRIDKATKEVKELYKNNIEKTDKLVSINNESYLAINNLVINLSKEDMVEYSLPGPITSLHYNKEFGLISLVENQIYLSDQSGNRKLFPSIGNLPSIINNICGSDTWLYIISENGVYVFDWINAEVKSLGSFDGYALTHHIDQWNILWLATNQGVYSFSGFKNYNSPIISSVVITDKNNRPLTLQNLKLNKEVNLINVTPNIFYLPYTEELITEWRTEEGNWRPFVKGFVLSEEMVSDGTSDIYIRSKSAESDFSQPYKFEIQNNINKGKIPTLWYAVLGSIVALLVLSFISLFNLRSKQNQTNLQIEKLKAENALLQSTQQIDQLKMNPHFIFNALNSINGLIATGKISESRSTISLFSKFLRQFLDQSQEENILLEDELELLSNYVKIEQVCRSDKFTFETDLTDDSLLDIKLPNMIIQPFIENAIIHAFPDSNEQGNIKLSFAEEEGYLVARVSDNGVGYENTLGKKKGHKSVAIDLVRKRLAQRDKNRRKHYLEYIDNKPGTLAKIYLQRL